MMRHLRHQPAKPMVAACCTADDVSFYAEGTSADGEPTGTDLRHRIALADPAIRSAWSRGLASPRARERAWTANPMCVECGMRVATADQAGLLVAPTGSDVGHRVAHKTPCFVRALTRINPHLNTAAALRRAGGR